MKIAFKRIIKFGKEHLYAGNTAGQIVLDLIDRTCIKRHHFQYLEALGHQVEIIEEQKINEK